MKKLKSLLLKLDDIGTSVAKLVYVRTAVIRNKTSFTSQGKSFFAESVFIGYKHLS